MWVRPLKKKACFSCDFAFCAHFCPTWGPFFGKGWPSFCTMFWFLELSLDRIRRISGPPKMWISVKKRLRFRGSWGAAEAFPGVFWKVSKWLQRGSSGDPRELLGRSPGERFCYLFRFFWSLFSLPGGVHMGTLQDPFSCVLIGAKEIRAKSRKSNYPGKSRKSAIFP